ncbi:MAG: hypothetical protein ACNA7K_01990 [Acholeplasmataceae bacterium]
MKKNKTFQNLYHFNNDQSAYMIEVSLEDYSELFNGWDASPLRRKDLEPELVDYLEQAGTEIPLKEAVELVFYLPVALKDSDKEQKSMTGIKNHLKVVLMFIDKTLYRSYRQVVTYISLSILFLLGAYLLRNSADVSLLFSIMVEGLFIGGWFLLWNAFSTFFFTSHETRQRRKIFKRFLNCNITFKDS